MRPEENLSEREQEDLTREVLRRTSGPACGRARRHLYGPAAGARDRVLVEILASHLEHCAACARIAETVAGFEALLPELREVEPGEAFTRRVLEATVGCGAARAHATGRRRIPWDRLVLRPRFALEAAYLVTALMFAVRPAVVAPLSASPRLVREIEIEEAFRSLPRFVPEARAESLWTASRGAVDSSRRAAIGAFERARAAAVDAWRDTVSGLFRVAGALSRWLDRTFG